MAACPRHAPAVICVDSAHIQCDEGGAPELTGGLKMHLVIPPAGDGKLTLNNGAGGTIEADLNGTALVLDTGNTIVNAGLLKASNGGTLQVRDSAITNSGANGLGILVAAASTLLVDVRDASHELTLTGGGQVTLDAGTLTGTAGQALKNVDNAI